VSETSPGTVTYSITCAGAPPAAAATTTVAIKSASDTTGTASSQGGGGSLDLLFVLGLGLLLWVRLTALTAAGDGTGARFTRAVSEPSRLR
jgi:hypothetical protein